MTDVLKAAAIFGLCLWGLSMLLQAAYQLGAAGWPWGH
jgi:hypothetical protein